MENKIINANISHLLEIEEIESKEILMPWSYNSLKDLLSNDNVVFRVMIDSSNKVIGYYSFAQILDEGHINNIAVRSLDQSKGFGTKLMEDMINQASKRGINALTLEVEIKNIKAINLYKKFNFTNEGIRKKYYKNTKDAMIMWRR